MAGDVETALRSYRQSLTPDSSLPNSSVKKVPGDGDCGLRRWSCQVCSELYGANCTGRWAGCIIQMQNPPQNHFEDLAEARGLVRNGDFEAVEISTKMCRIRCRSSSAPPSFLWVTANSSWLTFRHRSLCHCLIAGEEWRQKVFAEGRILSPRLGLEMVGVPVEKHGEWASASEGQNRRTAQLQRLCRCAKSNGCFWRWGLPRGTQPLVQAWRDANPNITKLWWAVDRAAMDGSVQI